MPKSVSTPMRALLFAATSACVVSIVSANDKETVLFDTLEIDEVWAANRVSFALQTVGNQQFVAYYDRNRMMTVATRELGSRTWSKKTLSSQLRWDSHNYVSLAIDKEGYVHVSGNMHVDPLAYYRSEKPYDIHSLVEVNEMLGGIEEESVTYPKFFYANDSSLLFSYRSGTCGNGNILVNRFLPRENRWERYLEEPLFAGIEADDDRAAYHHFVRDKQGNFHFAWIWRWTPEVATSHQICYAVTKDLIHWKNAFGENIELPLRPDDERLIVDPVPSRGGSHNGRYKVILDKESNPLVGYVKYDDDGNTQFYMAKPENGKWESRQISDWNFRWRFFEGGDQMTVGGAFNVAGISDEGSVVIDWKTEQGNSGRYIIDPNTLEKTDIAATLKPKLPPSARKRLSDNPKMSVVLAMDASYSQDSAVNYALKWEAMPKSHGRHAPDIIPDGPVSKLQLLEYK